MTRSQLYVLIATIVGSGVVVLDGSVVNLALPHIGRDLNVGFSGLQWIVDGYLLTLSALMLLGGSLGDIVGQRRIYYIGLIGFGVVSLLCGLAPTSEALVALRLLQGVFGALLVPSGLAIINTHFPPEQRGVAIGRWTAFSAIIIAIGPLVGGYLVDVGSWRWIFFINVPLVIATIILAGLGMKEHVAVRTRRVDWAGGLLAMLGLGGIIYGLIEGPVNGWSVVTVGTLVAGLVVMALFVWYEARAKDPMLSLRLFASNNFTAANITTFSMYGALGGFFFVLGIHLQTAAGYTALQAGASLLPTTVVLFFLSPRAGKWAAQYGARRFMTVGPLLAGAGIALLAPVGANAPYLTAVFPGIVVFSIGLGLTVAPLTSTVMGSVGAGDSGIASAVNNAVSRVAGLVVIALLGLFGAGSSYLFAVVLCAVLAVAAGIVSWLMVRDAPRTI